MSRTRIEVCCTDVEAAKKEITRILVRNNYDPISENGEVVWKCGAGFWTAMKYIKFGIFEINGINTVILFGWIRPVLGSEQSLDGILGIIPKKQVLGVIKKIQSTVR